MIKPERLNRGDTVAIISPSWGGPCVFPEVYQYGIDYLISKYGIKIKEYPTARMNPKVIYDNPKLRANDINNAFTDSEVKAIITTIGGSDSIRILEYLDLEILKSNPKILMGFSDTTTLLCYLNMHGLVTYHGNSIMAGFSYLSNFLDAEKEYQEVLFSNRQYEIKPYIQWSDCYESWNDKSKIGKVKEIKKNDIGFRWLQKGDKTIGKLYGGCIEILAMMNGTFAWPTLDFWEGKYLIIETSEDKPTPAEVGYILRNFGIQGIFTRVSGILIAKPKDYSSEEKKELDDEVIRIVAGEFKCTQINIISNIEFGHTDPRHIMPLGIDLEIDPDIETLKFIESLYK